MQKAVENLLILQDRDRRIHDLKQELARIDPERASLTQKAESSQSVLVAAKEKAKHIESQRKDLENQAESKRQQIAKYSQQQLETKKNEEYRALTNEIAGCNRVITELEDQQIDLMEAAETAAAEIQAASEEAGRLKAVADSQIAELNERERNLRQQLEELEKGRSESASAVEPKALRLYDRLARTKGPIVVVGINRGICAGCHMKLTTSAIALCQREEDGELVPCPNCSRILYYTRDMVLNDAGDDA